MTLAGSPLVAVVAIVIVKVANEEIAMMNMNMQWMGGTHTHKEKQSRLDQCRHHHMSSLPLSLIDLLIGWPCSYLLERFG